MAKTAKSTKKSAGAAKAAVNPDILAAFKGSDKTLENAVADAEAQTPGGNFGWRPPHGEYVVQFSKDLCSCSVVDDVPVVNLGGTIMKSLDGENEEVEGREVKVSFWFRTWKDPRDGKTKCIDAAKLKGIVSVYGERPQTKSAALANQAFNLIDGDTWCVKSAPRKKDEDRTDVYLTERVEFEE